MMPKQAALHPLLIRLCHVLTVVGIIASAFVVLGFLGQFAWWLDLFSHFRAQYLILFAVLCPVLWALRQRKISLIFLTIACVNFLPMRSLYFGNQKALPEGLLVLRAMLLNVNTSFGNPELVRQAIQEENPDLLVLEEINVRWMSDLVWLKKSHPFSAVKLREDNFGIGLFSKLPIVESKIINLSGLTTPTILATVRTRDANLRVIATHSLPPTSGHYSQYRNDQLDQLPNEITSSLPAMLLGDLNVTPWNHHFCRLLKRSGLLDSSKGFGYQPSWPNDNPLFLIPIDHVLHTSHISIMKRRIGPDVGSDHYPVIVDFVIKIPKADNSILKK